jgi:hypothetical protein
MAYSFDMPPGIDPRDDGSHSLPAYLGQALQFYGTDKSTDLPYYLSYPMNNQAGQSMFGGGAPMQSPVAQAMAPQQAPQTPVAQAMDPQSPQTPITQAMGGYPNSDAIQAMFANQATNPSMSMDNGLIAAGSAMMGGKDFKTGMADAGKAFNDNFDSTLNQQRELNTPRVTPVGQDGAFSMVQMPGQQPQVLPNSQVQDYVLGKVRAQKMLEMNNKIGENTMEAQRAAMKQDQTNGNAAIPVLTNLQQSQAGMDAARNLTETLKTDSSRAGYLKAYSALPSMAQRAAAAVGGGSMAQAAADYNTLNNAKIDGAKMEVAGLNGSLSNDEWTRAVGSVPSPSDSPAVWDAYYERANPILKSRMDFYTGVVKRGSEAANRPITPYGSNGRQDLGVPQAPAAPQATPPTRSSTGAGYQPVQVSSFAEASKLPSGTIFTDPNGKQRKVP